MKAYAGFLLGWLVLASAGCAEGAESEARGDAGQAQDSGAPAALDASAKSDAAQSDDDGGESALDAALVCSELCTERAARGSQQYEPCLSDCAEQWDTLAPGCQMAAANYGSCITATGCIPAAPCCYSEVGAFSDICPLAFQR